MEFVKRIEQLLISTLDAVTDEPEVDKIRYFTNGTVRALVLEEPKIERHRYYLELLRQCSVLDISVLKDCANPKISVSMGASIGETPWMLERGIDEELLQLSIHKLRRLNLLDDGRVEGDGVIEDLANLTPWNILTTIGKSFVEYFSELNELHVDEK